jgi:nucleoside-diphosphate-sugar epimerase
LGLLNVLELALQNGIWVVFISSFQIRERNLYGLSKLVGEELCRIYKRRGLKVRIVRLPIIFGPNDTPAKFINKVLRGENPPVKGNRKFHFLYVEDAIKYIEREVNVIDGNDVWGKKITLTKFKDGVNACLNLKQTSFLTTTLK